MALMLPELTDIDYTRLDFEGIISLAQKIIRNHPEYFSEIDDFTESNAARMTIELVAYIVELLSDRVDWIANELTLPTATQKQSVMNLLKLINYRLELPYASSVNVTATINNFVEPFVLPARYSVPARDREGNNVRFELLNKDDDGKYIYEGVGSEYEFDSGFRATPVLSHNDLIFYEGRSHREFFTMEGINNESIQLGNRNVEEGSIRAYRITRNAQGNVVSRRELMAVTSFISPEAQSASSSNLPPYKIQPTENNGVFLVFGERPVVATFNPSASEEIMVWYRTTSGANGNIVRNAINYTTTLLIQGQNIQIRFINPNAATGGAASETLEHAKRYGPLTLTTVNKTVNPEDFIILLQNFRPIVNAIAYGKSNEPSGIRSDFGYHIPPFETWIYALFSKSGWQDFPTYSYQQELQATRPYAKYGPLAKEIISFRGGNQINLEHLEDYALADSYVNVIVSDFFNETQYVPGSDFVIDLEARQIIRLDGGGITEGATVVVQYYENDKVDTDITINFATGPRQTIPNSPIYPGMTTYAWRIDLQKEFIENKLSVNDYDWPTNDYRIDYTTNEIIKNNTYPFIDGHQTFGFDAQLIEGVNNELIIAFDGLNRETFNADHDFPVAAFSGWCTIGSGGSVALPSGTYYFNVAIDGGSPDEYEVTVAGSVTPRQLVEEIWNNAVKVSDGTTPFSDLPVRLFTDIWNHPVGSPLITFMSTTTGANSSVVVSDGTSGTSLLSFELSNVETGSGEVIEIKEMARRCRFALNNLGLLTGFRGQELAAGEEEDPEIMSKADLLTPTTFDFPSGQNSVTFTLTGTGLGTYDGDHDVTFTLNSNSTTGRPAGPYDLTTYQGRIDLITAMQEDIDSAIAQDVIEVFWVRGKEDKYRIGFRLLDTAGSGVASISIKDAPSDTARSLLQMSESQSSEEGNLVEAKVSPESDMIDDFYLRFELLGALGENAFIQVKANNALHNNTLDIFQMSDNQKSRGSGILIRTLPGDDDVIEDGGLTYDIYDDSTPESQNNQFTLTITSAPSGYPDGDYVVTIAADTYNMSQLITAINTALETTESSGQLYDISDFIRVEKQEGYQRLRFIMSDYDEAADDPPDVEINNNDDTTVNTRAIDKLGFKVGQKMSTYSTILLHYAGNWVSDPALDQSDERSVKDYLADKRLISQDYVIRDPRLTSFDIRGTIYASKGFDRQIILSQVKDNIRQNFAVDQREFADPAAITNITRLIEDVEGTVYTTIQFFGKDYQKFKSYQQISKSAVIDASHPAENVVSRWNPESAFKITVDGTAAGGINYDGEYLIVVGDSWTDRDYDSLLDAILVGTGTSGGLQHAIPLAMGRNETNLGAAVRVTHSSGIFKFETVNEGPRVRILLEDPDDILTYGYQNFSKATTVLESEYTKNQDYSIKVSIDGGPSTNYEITSPASGDWPLSSIASMLNSALPSGARAGIDDNNKVRITSLLGGNQSTIDLEAGDTTGGQIDLISLIGPAETAVDGSHGYISCLDPKESGTLYISTPADEYGKAGEPTLSEREDAYNYKDEIPAKYDEILFISDDYYTDGIQDIENQVHGIILDVVELGRDND